MSFPKTDRIYPPADPQVTFTGKTVIVTGANTGVGFEAAAKFIEKDAQKVILAVRTVSKGEAAKEAIVKRYGHEDRIDVWELEMNNYTSIKQFAQKASQLDRLDIAVLNAGVYMPQFTSSPYGWEEMLQIHALSSTLLAILLLPTLQRSKTADSTPVLEFVNSTRHQEVDASLVQQSDDIPGRLTDPEGYNVDLHYNTSKLLQMFIMQEFADRVDPSSTIITSCDPGANKTDLLRHIDGFFVRNVAKPAIYMMFRRPEQGARTLVGGTSLGAKVHGRFWQHDLIQPQRDILVDENSKELQQKIWNQIIDAIRKDVPDIDAAIKQISFTK